LSIRCIFRGRRSWTSLWMVHNMWCAEFFGGTPTCVWWLPPRTPVRAQICVKVVPQAIDRAGRSRTRTRHGTVAPPWHVPDTPSDPDFPHCARTLHHRHQHSEIVNPINDLDDHRLSLVVSVQVKEEPRPFGGSRRVPPASASPPRQRTVVGHPTRGASGPFSCA
jgi:hypothetical protein